LLKPPKALLYDEHGGFYDHVPPPEAVNPDGKNAENGFDFTRLGLRVPAILASPWLPKGKVDNRVYDHTSLLATVKTLFNLPTFLTERDKRANAFEHNFLDAPRADTPTNLMATRAVAPPYVVAPSESMSLSQDQRSLDALVRALDDPGNEHEASPRIETRMERALRQFEGA
jgi:phospholipase C